MSESFALIFIFIIGGALLLLLFYAFYLGLKPDKKTETVLSQQDTPKLKKAEKPRAKHGRR